MKTKRRGKAKTTMQRNTKHNHDFFSQHKEWAGDEGQRKDTIQHKRKRGQ
jgi:hypothetical protein